MRRLIALALPLALLAGPASAGDAAPMTASGGRQGGMLMHAADYRDEGSACIAAVSYGPGAYPTPVRHDGSALTWRIEDPRRPLIAGVARGYGAGSYDVRTEWVPTTLEPVRSRGRTIAWLLRTEPVGYGDLRLTLTVTWPKERCGQDHVVLRYRALSLPV